MLISKKDVDFLQTECQRDETGNWYHMPSGKQVQVFVIGRSVRPTIIIPGQPDHKILPVAHIFLDDPPNIPYGFPITDSDLAEIKNANAHNGGENGQHNTH